MNDYIKFQIQTYLNVLMEEAHKTALEKGWWDTDRSIGETITEIHGELSEFWEGYKNGNEVSEKIPDYTVMSEELGDVILRVLDLGARLNLNVPGAVIAKSDYNKTRPYRHGKDF